MKHLKVLVGRLIRVLKRNLEKAKLPVSESELELFEKIKRIHPQSFLSKSAKDKYKQEGNEVIYSFHAEEVECIGKGKLNKPW
jgi:hypothetical protein